MTTIAVLGNGRVGGNLAKALTLAGHEVTVVDREPGAAADAARAARIVINATPGAAPWNVSPPCAKSCTARSSWTSPTPPSTDRTDCPPT